MIRVEKIDLHNLNLVEALEKVEKNLAWCLKKGVPVMVFNHGRGLHSSRNFSVIKMELRQLLKEKKELAEAGYRVVYGESDLPIALTFNEGNTLVVQTEHLHTYLGGESVKEKNLRIFSEEGRRKRKQQKTQRAQKRKR